MRDERGGILRACVNKNNYTPFLFEAIKLTHN